ncbi:Dynein family light intermediate chain [Trinorchestia longiramus]|nr:Dynein family light intermediate chain [Trinorchestia longiramus]
MALGVGVTQSALSGLGEIRKDKNEENENVWTKILAEVQSTERNKLPSCKSLLVLGDSESGKTTLVAKLQCNEDPKKGSGLEYAYIDVRDEYRDEHTRLSVWVLDGDPRHSELLQFGVNTTSLEHTVVLLTVSMETPWTIMDQLQIWASTLHEHLDSLKLGHDEVQRLQDKMTYAWQSYVEPGDELDGCGGASPLKPQPPVVAPGQGTGQRTSRNLDDEALFLPLPEGVLSRNLGVPIIVVVTKLDPSKPGVPGANEGVLANFFNSLLNKKTATIPTAAAAATVRSPNDKAAMRSDAAAELDRLTRSTSKPLSPAPSVNLNNSTDLPSQPNSSTDC